MSNILGYYDSEKTSVLETKDEDINMPVVFVRNANQQNQRLLIDSPNELFYNPSTKTLHADNFSGGIPSLIAGEAIQLTTVNNSTEIDVNFSKNTEAITTFDNADTFLASNSSNALKTITGLLLSNQLRAGLCPLDLNNIIPNQYLPGSVSDILEVANFAALPATGDSSKIYVTLDNHKAYRWGGSSYVEISASLVIGTTAGTAYDGASGQNNATNIALKQPILVDSATSGILIDGSNNIDIDMTRTTAETTFDDNELMLIQKTNGNLCRLTKQQLQSSINTNTTYNNGTNITIDSSNDINLDTTLTNMVKIAGATDLTLQTQNEIIFLSGFDGGGGGEDIIWKTNRGSGVIETMKLVGSNGNLGIGLTPNSSYKLDVNGNINIGSSSSYYFNGTKIIYTIGYGPQYNCRIIANESATASLQDGMYINYNSTGGTNAHLRFYANSTIQRMHIDASTGFVGIANNSPAYKLDVDGDCNLSSGSVYRINGVAITNTDTTYNNGTNITIDSNNNINLDSSLTSMVKISSSAGSFQIGSESEIKFYSDENGNNGGSDFVWFTTKSVGGTPQELMRIVGSTGNVTMDGQSLSVNNLTVAGIYKLNGVTLIQDSIYGTHYNARILANQSSTVAAYQGMHINYDSAGGANAHLRFYANGATQRMHIDAGTGRIGIGNSNPTQALDVTGNISASGNLNATGLYKLDGVTIIKNVGGIGGGDNPYINCRILQNKSSLSDDGMYINYDSSGSTPHLRLCAGGTTTRLYIKANSGFVGLGTESPTQKLDVVGNMYLSGSINIATGTIITNTGIEYPGLTGAGSSNRIGFKWASPNMYGRVDNVLSMVVGTSSDRRLKRNITNITNENSRNFLDLIQPRSYNSSKFSIEGQQISYDCDDIIYGGVAQEIEENFPELVHSPENNGIKSLHTEPILFMTISSVQMIDKTVQELKNKVDDLEKKNVDLVNKLNELGGKLMVVYEKLSQDNYNL